MSSFQEVEVEDLRRWFENRDITLVDIRNEEDYEHAHIPGAVCLQRENVASFIERTDRNKALVIYCYHGISSQSAAQYFAAQGFADVYSVKGGFEQWRNA